MRYFELGDMGAPLQLEAFHYDVLEPSVHDREVIAHALKERFEELGGEKARRSPTGVGVATAQTAVHHVCGPCRHRVQGVITTDVVVGEPAPALFGQAVGLVDGRVDVDRERFGARTGSCGPCPFQQFPRHHVQLTNMAPDEAAQKGAECGGRQYRMAQHRLGLTGS
jgi:hypothetical protein